MSPTGERPVSAAADALAVNVRRSVHAVQREGDLSVRSDTGQRLARCVCDYVRLRQREGAAPERVIVELKALRELERAAGTPGWRVTNTDRLTEQLVRWCLEEYFPPPS